MNTNSTKLSDLRNIGKTLEKKIKMAGIYSAEVLIKTGCENTILKISELPEHGICINMVYAIEGAIEGIRWHNITPERKSELKLFYSNLSNQANY